MGRYQSCQKQVNDKTVLIFTMLCQRSRKQRSCRVSCARPISRNQILFWRLQYERVLERWFRIRHPC